MHVDTWMIVGKLIEHKPYLLTSYGHKTEESARAVAKAIRELCTEVRISHVTRKTPRSKWERVEYVL